MRRREFLRVASGAAGATAVGASAAAAQETTTAPAGNETAGGGNGTATGNESTGGGNQSASGGGAAGGGATVDVAVVDYAFNPGTDSPLTIPPGTTVRWTWESNGHNIHVDSQPDGANWEGHQPLEDAGFTYEHTFTTTGDYHYWCVPHKSLGMVADITVEEGAPLPGQGGGGPTEVDPEHMGVPFQAHWVGTATLLGIFATLVFTFFFLKYGETPHSGYPEEK